MYTATGNRRKCPRFEKQVKLSVCRLQYPMTDVEMKTAYTCNVSETGLCFTCGEVYDNGTVLQLVVELLGWQHYLHTTAALVDPKIASKPLTAVGEVVWSKEPTDEEEEYTVGVEFKDIYEDDLRAFKQYLGKMLEKANQQDRAGL